ncbi:hypothetical protein ACWGKW_12140 [Streptomyces sp. NPDC054766]
MLRIVPRHRQRRRQPPGPCHGEGENQPVRLGEGQCSLDGGSCRVVPAQFVLVEGVQEVGFGAVRIAPTTSSQNL